MAGTEKDTRIGSLEQRLADSEARLAGVEQRIAELEETTKDKRRIQPPSAPPMHPGGTGPVG
jgi:uncharacterized coiled-coil protein SlyX